MIWSLVVGWIAKRGIVIGIAFAIATAVAFWDHKRAVRHRAEGANKVVAASKEQGRKRNEKVNDIRRSVKRSDAWKRLRDEYGAGG